MYLTMDINKMNLEDEQCSDEDTDLVKLAKRCVQRFPDSESDEEKEISENSDNNAFVANGQKLSHVKTNSQLERKDDSSEVTKVHKSRLRTICTSDDDSDPETKTVAAKNNQQQLQMPKKKNKLKETFQKLITSAGSDDEMENENYQIDNNSSSNHDSNVTSVDTCGSAGVSSIVKIKKKFKKRVPMVKTTLYDPDTSDEENCPMKSVQKNKEMKTTILTSPKPIKLTAKQALENMQKIKSESNRMLREKEVSLPYHRPKALTLKDIMSRRKPAVASDGKALPIKMNDEQLKQYVQLLEQRQKELMELCKSDTDEETENTVEETNPQSRSLNLHTDCNKHDISENGEITDIDTANKDENKIINCNNNAQDYDSTKLENESVGLPENKTIDKTENISNSNVKLIYEDSVDSSCKLIDNVQKYGNSDKCINSEIHNVISKQATDNQSLSLHNDTDTIDNEGTNTRIGKEVVDLDMSINNDSKFDEINQEMMNINDNDFDTDNVFDIEEIDKIIENAEINTNCEQNRKSLSDKATISKNIMPKLTGAPGMVIDFDASDTFVTNKSGVELLKERFTYFAKLKTPEELEREKERRLKPGTQHLKLKQELEEQIAEQRSLEWAKRLENDKQNKLEVNAVLGDVFDDDDIEKMEAKLSDEELINNTSESEEEEEVEDDIELKDTPRTRNPLIDDEAEESNEEESNDVQTTKKDDGNRKKYVDVEINNENELEFQEASEIEADNESDSCSSENESSESEVETNLKPKKGRILKAFEDSDDDDNISDILDKNSKLVNVNNSKETIDDNRTSDSIINCIPTRSHVTGETQDDDLQLAQIHKSFSEDLFTSQESGIISSSNQKQPKDDLLDLGTQTFSILNTTDNQKASVPLDLVDSDKMTVICETPPDDDANLDAIVGMCSGSFSQNLVTSQLPTTQTQSQAIGEDILNLCTGKFYDNEFVSQTEENVVLNSLQVTDDKYTNDSEPKADNSKKSEDRNLLKSILDELNDPEFDIPKSNVYFPSSTENKENVNNMNNTQFKKKFIIDSDDEIDKSADINGMKQKKKIKKKKLEKRALQISDDEEDEDENNYVISDLEDDADENATKLVEYDSEENEVEVKPQDLKKKRKMADFFEQEAELTSEDEWVGSGDEDEADLDRMEREAGDDETFNQKKLQRELGQIHLRDVLDQDKREVRIIQELMFEDGDLGAGGRQRKFRWRNADDEEEVGTMPEEFADTQEEEFESEEQWRKQRHEREVFLRQMEHKDDKPEDNLNMSINRTTIIKANLCSRTMSSLLSQVNKTTNEMKNSPSVPEKKNSKDVPSPKKAFAVFQQNYHGSLLSRGRGALARLAALATPLAVDDDAPKIGSLLPSNKRNFVFAALTQEDNEPKVQKRKAETNIGTPKLVKKMKTEEKRKGPKSSNDKLFPYAEDHVKQFLESKWDEEKVKEAVDALRKLSVEDKEKSVEGAIPIPGEDATKEEQIEGLVNNVKWQMSMDRKAGPLKLLQGLIWKQGYDKGEIKGHVYDDVSPALEQWRTVEGQKVYIYSSGSVQAQKLLFGQSMAGDLLPLIDGHFDTAVGAKQEAASYVTIVEQIGCKSDEILFLTDIVKEAEAARASGLHVALVSREGNAPLPVEATSVFPVLHSLAQLIITNKRKPDSQEEQPAKIAKTDVENDVKTTPEKDTTEVAITPAKETEKVDIMKVEQEVSIEEKPKEINNDQEMTEVVSNTCVKVTDSSEVADIPSVNGVAEITENNVDKTEEKETEKMDTEQMDTEKANIDAGNSDVPNSDKCTKVEEKQDVEKEETNQSPTEEIPSVVITEIEDVSDKQPLNEKIIEDLEPVIEEPPVVEDMEELQNAGEVLEKECDEILSKVQGVTNLDNIPLKPLLNSIAEETIESENVDSNDIVDRILDTELEMEMKQCNDVDLNTVEEIKESKTDKECENTVQDEANTVTPVTEDVPEQKTTENNVEANCVTEKVEDIRPTETTAASECKPDEKENDEKSDDVESKEPPAVPNSTESSDAVVTVAEDIKEVNNVNEQVKMESEPKEPHLNGKGTNGTTETTNLNGDASKSEELNSRLSVENGKEVMNGSNGDSIDAEKVPIENAVGVDIKVKTVAVEEPHTDQIEQPTEA
ncbi:claspin-like [Achroia grisella]|uniref:claspin-like n=1 Tax=Achroia grisella TaxID=688607 RepID=UPI0027D2670D|nr:claspin-like [Achroia grisella]